MLELSGSKVYLDFILNSAASRPAVISYYDRSLTTVKSVGAALNYSNEIANVLSERGTVINRIVIAKSQYNTYIQPIVIGKEKYYHAISIHADINKGIILLDKQNEANDFYNYLMAEFNLPLMREWSDALLQAAKDNRCLSRERISPLIRGVYSVTEAIPIGKREVPLEEATVYSVGMSEGSLKHMVEGLLKNKTVKITDHTLNKLKFDDMDSYFKEYGSTLASNLEKTIVPLCELSGDVSDFTLNTMRLYPQQVAQINGVLNLLDRSSYSILNFSMGTGKTVIGASICEAYHVRKWMRSNPGKTLVDAYTEKNAIRYRNIVVCPGHLVGATCYRT